MHDEDIETDERRQALNEAISVLDDLISDAVSIPVGRGDYRGGYRHALDRAKVRLVELYTGETDEDLYDPSQDDSDRSDELRESREYHPDRE